MAITVSVVESGGGAFAVEFDGARVGEGMSMLEALAVAALLVRCAAGDASACAELDARGVAPPVVEVERDGVVYEPPRVVDLGSLRWGASDVRVLGVGDVRGG